MHQRVNRLRNAEPDAQCCLKYFNIFLTRKPTYPIFCFCLKPGALHPLAKQRLKEQRAVAQRFLAGRNVKLHSDGGRQPVI